MFWWSPRGAEIAFCFEKHGAAAVFQIYCVNGGIENRPEWPETIEYRVATGNDETDILEVLKEVAPEVPFSLDTTKKEDMLKIVIGLGCASVSRGLPSMLIATSLVSCLLLRTFLKGRSKGTAPLIWRIPE